MLHTKVTVFHNYCVKYLSRRQVFLLVCSRLPAFPSLSMRFLKNLQYLGGTLHQYADGQREGHTPQHGEYTKQNKTPQKTNQNKQFKQINKLS